jgi:two-component system, chemotaxis family, response regulator Rcp1
MVHWSRNCPRDASIGPMPHSIRGIYDVFLIADRANDLEVVRAVLSDRNHRVRLNSVTNAAAAIDYMCRRGEYLDAPMADLVILDLKANDAAGREFLIERSRHPLWRIPPVIVLVTDEDDVLPCYDSGANCCIRRPDKLDELATLIAIIGDHWLKVVSLPPSEWRLRELNERIRRED